MFFMVWLVEFAVGALVKAAVLFPMSQLVAVHAESSSGEFLQYLFQFPEEWECIDLVEALYKVGLQRFSLLFVGVLVFIGDEVSVSSV